MCCAVARSCAQTPLQGAWALEPTLRDPRVAKVRTQYPDGVVQEVHTCLRATVSLCAS